VGVGVGASGGRLRLVPVDGVVRVVRRLIHALVGALVGAGSAGDSGGVFVTKGTPRLGKVRWWRLRGWVESPGIVSCWCVKAWGHRGSGIRDQVKSEDEEGRRGEEVDWGGKNPPTCVGGSLGRVVWEGPWGRGIVRTA
jgi:hypothetical protein